MAVGLLSFFHNFQASVFAVLCLIAVACLPKPAPFVLYLPVFCLFKKAVVGVAGNYISGDRNSKDRKLNTYNLFFSKPQYGLAAPIGATNIATINPYMKMQPTSKLNIYTGINFLWRQSEQDGIYSPGAI